MLRRPSAALALALAPLLLAGCGESSQAKAKAQACSAHAEIAAQVARLEGLPISASLLTDAKASVEAIDKGVAKIKNAEPKLEPAVKQQVEAGTKSFQAEMTAIEGGLALAVKVPGGLQRALQSVGPEIKAALAQLSTSYKQAYGSLKC
jgi:outer membrane murein-binding lipoprotein Lpp